MSPSLLATRLCALTAIAAAAAMSGCASGYSTSYRAAEGVSAQAVAEPKTGSTAEPVVERLAAAAAQQGLLEAYEKRGYTLIGSSAFNSARNESEADAIAQGRKVGADLVLILKPSPTAAATTTVQVNIPASYRHTPATAFGTSPAGYESSQVTSARMQSGQPPATMQRTVQQTHFGAAYFVRQR